MIRSKQHPPGKENLPGDQESPGNENFSADEDLPGALHPPGNQHLLVNEHLPENQDPPGDQNPPGNEGPLGIKILHGSNIHLGMRILLGMRIFLGTRILPGPAPPRDKAHPAPCPAVSRSHSQGGWGTVRGGGDAGGASFHAQEDGMWDGRRAGEITGNSGVGEENSDGNSGNKSLVLWRAVPGAPNPAQNSAFSGKTFPFASRGGSGRKRRQRRGMGPVPPPAPSLSWREKLKGKDKSSKSGLGGDTAVTAPPPESTQTGFLWLGGLGSAVGSSEG